MPAFYQITFYQIDCAIPRSVVLQSEQAYPDLQVGDVFPTDNFHGLAVFSSPQEVVYVQLLVSTLSHRGNVYYPRLIITRPYEQYEQCNSRALSDYSHLTNTYMGGNL
jgi:hypothetical protein